MTTRTSWLKMSRELGTTILRFLIIIAVAGTLSSCLPGPHGAYYKPSYPDDSATFSRRDCSGYAGPFSVIKIPIQDGHINVRLDKGSQDSLSMGLSLKTSGQSKLQFTSDIIRLTDLDKGREWVLRANPFYFDYWRSGQIPYSEPVDFAGRLPTAPENILKDMEVWIPFSIDDFLPDVVHVHLPPIVAGASEIRVPPMIWKADKEGKSMDSYKKSWDWWPYTEDKVKADRVTVHAGVTGGYHGSSKIDKRLQVPSLKGNIMIEFPADMTWRFASNEVVFEDVNFGKSRCMHFQHLQDRSSLTVAFPAEFCCTSAAWSTTLLAKGEELPEKIRVELPPLLINGKKFVIKPITFELHRFEFGIYPFNC